MKRAEATRVLKGMLKRSKATAAESRQARAFDRTESYALDGDGEGNPRRVLMVQHRYDTRTEKVLHFNPRAVSWAPDGAHDVIVLSWEGFSKSIDFETAIQVLMTGEPPRGFVDLEPEPEDWGEFFDALNGLPRSRSK